MGNLTVSVCFLQESDGTPGSQCLISTVQWWNTCQSVSVFCSTVMEHLPVSVCFLQYSDGTTASQCLFSAAEL